MKKVGELLESGYLEYSNSPWSSRVWLDVINNKLDICVGYGELNAITKDYVGALPTASDVLRSITQSNVFSKVCP